MILFYYNESKSEHKKVIVALYESCPAEVKYLYPTSKFEQHTRLNSAAKLIVFAGMIRGDGAIFKWCKKNNVPFLYMDHAYINRGYSGNPDREWMRITYNDFIWNRMEVQNSKRWKAHFWYYELKPWMCNRDKGNILILPPSLSTQWLYPEITENWLQRMVRVIQQNTQRSIVVREKPLQVVLGSDNQILDRVKYTPEKTIEQELDDAYCVVTFNSAVAVQATIWGIPVYCHESAAAAPMSIDMSCIDNPPEPPRLQWLHQLVHHQFRTAEMQDGTVWRMLDLKETRT